MSPGRGRIDRLHPSNRHQPSWHGTGGTALTPGMLVTVVAGGNHPAVGKLAAPVLVISNVAAPDCCRHPVRRTPANGIHACLGGELHRRARGGCNGRRAGGVRGARRLLRHVPDGEQGRLAGRAAGAFGTTWAGELRDGRRHGRRGRRTNAARRGVRRDHRSPWTRCSAGPERPAAPRRAYCRRTGSSGRDPPARCACRSLTPTRSGGDGSAASRGRTAGAAQQIAT